jgi:hypothetical protein
VVDGGRWEGEETPAAIPTNRLSPLPVGLYPLRRASGFASGFGFASGSGSLACLYRALPTLPCGKGGDTAEAEVGSLRTGRKSYHYSYGGHGAPLSPPQAGQSSQSTTLPACHCDTRGVSVSIPPVSTTASARYHQHDRLPAGHLQITSDNLLLGLSRRTCNSMS